MPRVLQINGYQIYIYTHDHLPSHVHVKLAEMEVEIYIETLGIKAFNRHATQKFIRTAQETVAEHQEFLVDEWNRIEPVP